MKRLPLWMLAANLILFGQAFCCQTAKAEWPTIKDVAGWVILTPPKLIGGGVEHPDRLAAYAAEKAVDCAELPGETLTNFVSYHWQMLGGCK